MAMLGWPPAWKTYLAPCEGIRLTILLGSLFLKRWKERRENDVIKYSFAMLLSKSLQFCQSKSTIQTYCLTVQVAKWIKKRMIGEKQAKDTSFRSCEQREQRTPHLVQNEKGKEWFGQWIVWPSRAILEAWGCL